MYINEDIRYIGVSDMAVDLFEGQYRVPDGMVYNSYMIIDEETAVMNSVDANFVDEWLDNIAAAGRQPDYLVVQHMEPDHNAGIAAFMKEYPKAKVVASKKAFAMMQNFFGTAFEGRRIEAGDGGELSLGKHSLTFVAAPMVHWPEVMVVYDACDKVLFSADGFGRFGQADESAPWADEARRYYIGIVGKYGAQVQSLLKKASALDIEKICPLHGPVLTQNLGYYIDLYDKWSGYKPENDGIMIAYTSVYGGTKKAALALRDKLIARGCSDVAVYDLARTDMALAVSEAFRYPTLVLATTTYNADIFPYMRHFIWKLTERSYQNRRVALIENGSWAPMAAKVMKDMLSGSKNISFCESVVKIMSAPNADNELQLEALASELTGAVEAPVTEEAPAPATKKFVCKVCGYEYEGEELPADFRCPLCKCPAKAFEEVK